MKIETIKCDIKKCGDVIPSKKKQVYQVIFRTERAEGYPCSPYLCFEELDLCETCHKKVLEGKAIFGAGAQGINDFYFIEEE